MSNYGVDTQAIVFRPPSHEFWDRLRGVKGARLEGSWLRLPRDESGIDVRARGEVVRVEGRLDPLLTGSRESWGLRPVGDLVAGERAARQLVERLAGRPMVVDRDGRPLSLLGELARVDLTTELSFAESSEGLAFLATLAALCPAGLKSDVHRAADGRCETVAFITPKRGERRFYGYDKGVESGSHAAGLRVRLEARSRFPRSKRQWVSDFAAHAQVARLYGARVEPFTTTETVVVAAEEVERELMARHFRGEVSIAKAERLLGTVRLLRHYGRTIYADSSGRRRVAELRKLGIAVEALCPPEHLVPVGRLLAESIAVWSAEASAASTVPCEGARGPHAAASPPRGVVAGRGPAAAEAVRCPE